jgi:23S rRNA (guanosine2251-2'-O)-methyltransferase
MEAVRSGRALRVLAARGARETEGLRALIQEAARAGTPIEQVEAREIDRLGLTDHQGVAAIVDPPQELDDRALANTAFPPASMAVALDGVTDPQNLGACARSAEAAGASVLIVRRKRAAPLTSSAVRASAGALLHLPMARVTNLVRTLEQLKDRGFTVVGLDHRAPRSIHGDRSPERPLVLVVGSEGAGLSRLVSETCDLLVSIPMPGRTGSLNASAALAVALFGYVLRPPERG